MCLVTRETFDWVLNGGELPEAIVKARFDSGRDVYSPSMEDIRNDLRGASNDNDRALSIDGDPVGKNGEVYFEPCYGSVKDVMAFIKEHDLELDEEYEGYIY